MLSKTANISYNLASKYDIQMSKKLQLQLRSQTPYRGSSPGPSWGSSVPQTFCVPPTSKSWLCHWAAVVCYMCSVASLQYHHHHPAAAAAAATPSN